MLKSVVPHNPAWADDFGAESDLIRQALGAACIAVHHIGSTSIPGILAKPIIDILVEATSLANVDEASPGLDRLGYEAKGEYGIRRRRYFRKTRSGGVRTHHIHIYAQSDENLNRHIAFRDYLRANPGVARDYSDLKATLIAGGNVIWSEYQADKDEFIEATEFDAIAWCAVRPLP